MGTPSVVICEVRRGTKRCDRYRWLIDMVVDIMHSFLLFVIYFPLSFCGWNDVPPRVGRFIKNTDTIKSLIPSLLST